MNLKNWLSDHSPHCSDHPAAIQPAVLHGEPDQYQVEVAQGWEGLYSLGREAGLFLLTAVSALQVCPATVS